MIRHKVKIEYRDDTKKEYDCQEPPIVSDKFLIMYMEIDSRDYIPLEAIASFTVKDYWAGKK